MICPAAARRGPLQIHMTCLTKPFTLAVKNSKFSTSTSENYITNNNMILTHS